MIASRIELLNDHFLGIHRNDFSNNSPLNSAIILSRQAKDLLWQSSTKDCRQVVLPQSRSFTSTDASVQNDGHAHQPARAYFSISTGSSACILPLLTTRATPDAFARRIPSTSVWDPKTITGMADVSGACPSSRT